MSFNDELNSRIIKNSENILLLFHSEYIKNLFIKKFNPPKNCILLTIQNLEHKLVGLRYSEYRYINRDVIFRLENKKLNNLGDDDCE